VVLKSSEKAPLTVRSSAQLDYQKLTVPSQRD
jgi:hypothetical protein